LNNDVIVEEESVLTKTGSALRTDTYTSFEAEPEVESEKSSTRDLKITKIRRPQKLVMINPLNAYNSKLSRPLTYTVKSMTPLERSKKMNELEYHCGQINITDNYFDFHQSYIKPDINEHEVILSKVMADKLMEYKFAKKLAGCHGDKRLAGSLLAYKNIMNQRGQNEIYKKS